MEIIDHHAIEFFIGLMCQTTGIQSRRFSIIWTRARGGYLSVVPLFELLSFYRVELLLTHLPCKTCIDLFCRVKLRLRRKTVWI